MPSVNLPIVSASINAGEAAKRASRANVSAVVVRADASSALELVKLQELPDDADGPLSSFIQGVGTAISRTEPISPDPNGFALVADHGEVGEFNIGDHHLLQINALIGYKVCTVDNSHQYPANFPKRNCPRGDTGILKLKYF